MTESLSNDSVFWECVTYHVPNVSEKLLLTVPEAAERLGMSGRRLYTLIAQKALPDAAVIRLGNAGRTIVFRDGLIVEDTPVRERRRV